MSLYIGRFQKINRWDDLVKDLSELPEVSFESQSDRPNVEITLEGPYVRIMLWLVKPEFYYAYQEYKLMNIIKEHRIINGKPPFPDNTEIQGWGGSGGPNGYWNFIIKFKVIDMFKALGWPLELITEEPPLEIKGPTFWCKLGIHNYEKEPVLIEYCKNAGGFALFGDDGIQRAVVRCVDCGFRKDVYKEGVTGLFGYSSKWKSCSKYKKEYIDKLPSL